MLQPRLSVGVLGGPLMILCSVDFIVMVHGWAGRVFTVLRVEEVRHFKGLLRKVDNAFVKDHPLPKADIEAARPEAQHALSVLQAYLASES